MDSSSIGTSYSYRFRYFIIHPIPIWLGTLPKFAGSLRKQPWEAAALIRYQRNPFVGQAVIPAAFAPVMVPSGLSAPEKTVLLDHHGYPLIRSRL
jgi:hypothetical protein